MRTRTIDSLKPFLSFVMLLGLCACTTQNPRVATKINHEAGLVGKLPVNVLDGKLITSWVEPARSTMSTLYGNDVAVQYARTSSLGKYPAGSVLTLVTWKQQEDPRWFGARIPSAEQSVEFVTIAEDATHHFEYSYEKYEGSPLQKSAMQRGFTPTGRVAELLSQRAAVMP